MKFSKKSRYALKALIDLTVYSKSDHVVLSSIAERNSISPQYLEQVFASLRRAGIIKSMKGSQGGYLLNHAPGDITVSEILEAIEGSYWLADEELLEDGTYQGSSVTIQKLIIDQVNVQIDEVLKNLTLADLEKDYLDNSRYSPNMYYI